MITIENAEVYGWEAAIRGMRNPMNSWEKSDSLFGIHQDQGDYSYWGHDINGGISKTKRPEHVMEIGPNDHDLMMRLAKAGSEHAKYRRMIVVYVDITAPLYWWKEFDTYKVGTVANSCSTMHKIAEKEFTLEDFSTDHLLDAFKADLRRYVHILNVARDKYLETKDKAFWWQMIQLLPSSYNQRRTLMLNYEALANIYRQRQGHKLDEWRDFCAWIETLPYSEIITGKDTEERRV